MVGLQRPEYRCKIYVFDIYVKRIVNYCKEVDDLLSTRKYNLRDILRYIHLLLDMHHRFREVSIVLGNSIPGKNSNLRVFGEDDDQYKCHAACFDYIYFWTLRRACYSLKELCSIAIIMCARG